MTFGDKPVLSEHRAQSRCGVEGGGEIVAEGTPEDVAGEKRSYTGQYLAEILARSARVESGPARMLLCPIWQTFAKAHQSCAENFRCF